MILRWWMADIVLQLLWAEPVRGPVARHIAVSIARRRAIRHRDLLTLAGPLVVVVVVVVVVVRRGKVRRTAVRYAAAQGSRDGTSRLARIGGGLAVGVKAALGTCTAIHEGQYRMCRGRCSCVYMPGPVLSCFVLFYHFVASGHLLERTRKGSSYVSSNPDTCNRPAGDRSPGGCSLEAGNTLQKVTVIPEACHYLSVSRLLVAATPPCQDRPLNPNASEGPRLV